MSCLWGEQHSGQVFFTGLLPSIDQPSGLSAHTVQGDSAACSCFRVKLGIADAAAF